MLLSPRNQLIASLLLAGAGLVMFFGDDYRALGLPLGFVGVWLFIAAVWFFVDAVHRVPRSEAELGVAPREWQAWVGLAFVSAILVAMLLQADAFIAQVPIGKNPEAAVVGRRIGTMFVAWLVLDWVLRQRWKGAVIEDERDRRIDQVASGWGRGATAACVVGVAVMLGFSPTDRLQAFSYPFLAHLLMFSLLWGAWFDHAVSAWLYWRDRREAAA
jgi:uncharacterized membrane protein